MELDAKFLTYTKEELAEIEKIQSDALKNSKELIINGVDFSMFYLVSLCGSNNGITEFSFKRHTL